MAAAAAAGSGSDASTEAHVGDLYLTDFPASFSDFTSSAMGYWALAAQRP